MSFRLLMCFLILPHCCQSSEDTDATICGFPGAPAYGYVVPDQDVYEQDSMVEYTCRMGYSLFGPPVRKCTENGSWTEDIPVCDGRLAPRGTAFSTPTTSGHPAAYAIDRDPETCAVLKSKKPTWWRVDLDQLHDIQSVAVTVQSTTKHMKFTIFIIEIIGVRATYKRCGSFSGKFETQTIELNCFNENGLQGHKVHIEDNLQEGGFELCEVKVKVAKDIGFECGQPDRRPFSITYEPENGKVQYRCETGYELVGDSTRECLPSGQWSGEAPACEYSDATACSFPGSPAYGYVTPVHDVYEQDSIIEYTCESGYTLFGTPVRRCTEDGSWTAETPACEEIVSAVLTAFSAPTVAKHPPEYAIDGDLETCTVLAPNTPAWLRINLDGFHKILSIVVTMGSTNQSVDFSVYVIEVHEESEFFKPCGIYTGIPESTEIVFTCQDGNAGEGNKIQIENNLRENVFEVCEIEVQAKKVSVCEPLKEVQNGELSFHRISESSIKGEGTRAIYKCYHGYELKGESARLCQKDGSWSGKEPVCKGLLKFKSISNSMNVGSYVCDICRRTECFLLRLLPLLVWIL